MADLTQFRLILAVIGNSFFLGDIRTDLKHVRNIIDQLKAQVYGNDGGTVKEGDNATIENITELNVLEACFHAVCGRFKQAFEKLRLAKDALTSLPPDWALHISFVDIYLQCLRRYPNCTEFRMESGIAQDARNLTTRYAENMQATFAAASRMINDIGEANVTEIIKLEMMCLTDLLTCNNFTCFAAYPLHPAYPQYGWSSSERLPNLQKQIDQRLSHLENVKKVAITLSLDSVCEFAQYQGYLYLHASGGQHAPQICKENIDIYEKLEQPNGRAMWKMLTADAILSPPWTNPIAFNLMPMDNIGLEIKNPIWDVCEDNIVLKRTPEADRLYEQAYDLFTFGNCARGRASILLRQAAIEISMFSDQAVENADEWRNRSKNIDSKLGAAVQLLDDDEARLQIALGHQVLFGTLTGADRSELRKIACGIGSWGKENMNEGVSQFVGMLFLRFGRRQWLDHDRLDVAEECFRHAYHLFIQLNDVVMALKAIGALIGIFDILKDDVGAKAFLSGTLHTFPDAIHRIQYYVTLSDGTEKTASLLQMCKNLLISQTHTIMPIFSRTRDHAGLAAWKATTKDLHDSTEAQLATVIDVWAPPNTTDGRIEHELREAHSSIEEISSFAQVSDKALEDYTKLIQRNEVAAAIKVMQDFVDVAPELPCDKRVKCLKLIRAYYLMGDIIGCRRTLASLSEEELFNEDELQKTPVFVTDAPWCRSQWSTRLDYPANAEIATFACAQAQEWDRAQHVVNRILEASPGFYDPDGPNRASDQSSRFKWTGLVYEHNMKHKLAFEYYSIAANIYATRRRWAGGVDAKTSFYSLVDVGEVFIGLARIALRCSHTKVPFQVCKLEMRMSISFRSWDELVVAILGEGSARSLLDSFDARAVLGQQRQTVEEAGLAYQKRLLMHLKALPATSMIDLERREIADLEAKLPSAMSDLSRLQMSTATVRSLEVADLCSCLNMGTLVVQISFSRYGSLMTALTINGIEQIVSLEASSFDIACHARGVMKSIKDYSTEFRKSCDGGHDPEVMRRLCGLRDLLDKQLSEVSRAVVDPIKTLIKRSDHIVFCGAQYLSGFPLGALLVDGIPLFHLAAVSLTPSLSVLHRLCEKASEVKIEVTGITKPGSMRDYLVLKEPPLPYAGIETMLITNLFGTWPVMAKKTTNDDFVHLMETSTIMHVGTHGQLHPESPYLSSISLKQNMRVLELSRCQSNAALVVFAACLSGIGNNTIGNDVEGFTHAVLGTGTMAFVGALWEVDDVSTMILMVLFYRALSGRLDCHLMPETMRPSADRERTLAALWRAASLVFYHLDGPKAKSLVKEFIVELEECHQRSRNDPNKIVKNWRTYLDNLLVETKQTEDGTQELPLLDLIDFKHPFFYASFIPVGFGDLVITLPSPCSA